MICTAPVSTSCWAYVDGNEDCMPFEVHVQTDGHLESELHVLVNVSGVLVKLNSKNTQVTNNLTIKAKLAEFNFESVLHFADFQM